MTKNEALEKRVERLWDWLIHEENLHISRVNFFLIAEAMIFAGYATLVAASESVNRVVLIMFGIVGIGSSVAWAYASWIQMKFTIDVIHEKLRGIDQDFEEIISKRERVWIRIPINILLGICFPIFLAAIWLILLKQTALLSN